MGGLDDEWVRSGSPPEAGSFVLERGWWLRHILAARAHGMWTYEPRQGRKAATVVCSASAVVTLASDLLLMILDLCCGFADSKHRRDRNHKARIHDGLSSYRP